MHQKKSVPCITRSDTDICISPGKVPLSRNHVLMKKILRILLPALTGLACCLTTEAATVTIDTTTHFQTIDGFGGGSVYYTNWLPAHPDAQAIYDTMFTGLGLSYLRLANWNQDTTGSLADDSTIVAEGRKRLGSRFKIIMSSWSAPGHLKGSGSTTGSLNGTMYSRAQNTLKKSGGTFVYAEFAHWWKRSLARYANMGIVPDVISIQNEPDMNAGYHETLFDATQNDSIAGYPQALKAVHDSLATMTDPPQIYGPEVLGIGYGNFQKYANAMDRNLVDGYNYHLYHGSTGDSYVDPDGFTANLNTLTTTYTGKPWIMSEYCPMRDGNLPSDMLTLAHLIINMLTKGNVSAYINWELIWGDHGQMIEVDNPWTTKTWKVNPEYHGIRHFSRFTSPGWHRVAAASDDANVRTVAFTSPTGDSITLVALNLDTLTEKTLSTGGVFTGNTDVWQSVAKVSYSERLSPLDFDGTGTITLPPGSITTVVWTPSAATGLTPAQSTSRGISLSGSGGRLTLTTALAGAGEIAISSLDGRTLFHQAIPAGAGVIPLERSLPPGVFIARMRQGNESRILRFVTP